MQIVSDMSIMVLPYMYGRNTGPVPIYENTVTEFTDIFGEGGTLFPFNLEIFPPANESLNNVSLCPL